MDEDKAFGIVETYTANGGNFIDTADVYGMGVSEKIIGRYLKQSGKKLFVATKLGRRQDAPNGWPQNFTYDAMRRHVEDSLRHLDIDQLFLEQLHCIPSAELTNDYRNYNHNGKAFNRGETFSEIEFGKALQFVDKISKILPAANLAQYSLKWILQHPEITTVIPGASSAAQVSSNIKVTELSPVSDGIMQQLSDLYSREIYPSIRGRF